MSVPPATQKPCTLQSTGLSEWNRLMKPRTLRLIIWKSITGSQVPLRVVVRRLDHRGRVGEPRAAPARRRTPSDIRSAEATRS